MKLFSNNIKKLAAVAAITGVLAISPLQAKKMSDPSIVDIASGDLATFSTLVAAVVKADLVGALDGYRNYTVFAPTNTAFDAAAEAVLGVGTTGEQLVDALDADTLRSILLYHVSPGERFSGDVLDSTKIRTMSKQFIGVNGTTLEGIGSSANLILSAIDIGARNGVIHVIDFVLLPFTLEE